MITKEDVQEGMRVDVVLTTGETLLGRRVENVQKVLNKLYFTFKSNSKWSRILGNGAYGEDRIVSFALAPVNRTKQTTAA